MALKVFNFKCKYGHLFEAMVPSVKDFEKQRDAGLFTCPFCDSADVEKVLSAPHVAGKKVLDQPRLDYETEERLQSFIKGVRQQIDSAEDVGEKFASEARAMHYGDMPERNIKGTAKLEDMVELLEEGVPVLPLGVKDKKKVN